MSKVCALCGKGPSFGHNRSHSMVATNRRFNPNLQRVRILVNGVARRSYVCTRCLKAGKVQRRSNLRAGSSSAQLWLPSRPAASGSTT